jgi:hypothetical protein
MARKPAMEMVSIIDGKRTDAHLHDPILDNPEADAYLSKIAIERAIAGGMSRARAQRLYGIPDAQSAS